MTCSCVKYQMGVTAENVAKRYAISRTRQDEFAVASQRTAEEVPRRVTRRFERELSAPLALADGLRLGFGDPGHGLQGGHREVDL